MRVISVKNDPNVDVNLGRDVGGHAKTFPLVVPTLSNLKSRILSALHLAIPNAEFSHFPKHSSVLITELDIVTLIENTRTQAKNMRSR